MTPYQQQLHAEHKARRAKLAQLAKEHEARAAEAARAKAEAEYTAKLELARKTMAREVDILSRARETLPPPKQGVSINDVLRIVGATFGVTIHQIKGREKWVPLSNVQHVAMHVLRDTLKLSWPQVSRAVGGRHHSVAIHSYEIVEGWRKNPAHEIHEWLDTVNKAITLARSIGGADEQRAQSDTLSSQQAGSKSRGSSPRDRTSDPAREKDAAEARHADSGP